MKKNYLMYAIAGLIICLIAVPLQAMTIVDDTFADGDFAKTGSLDTPWWTSSSSSGKEISAGSLGLVSGTSGRGIHTIFPTQTLTKVGHKVTASWTFTTPATIDTSGSNNSAFRVGLFDDLGRAGLNADVAASSNVNSGPGPNALYGWGSFVGDGAGGFGPGTQTIPGFMLDYDVYNNSDLAAAAGADLNFRRHNDTILEGTGRLMATTGNFSNVSPSGPDAGYVWDPNSEYSGSLTIERVINDQYKLTATLDVPGGTPGVPEHTYTNFSEFDSENFNMLAFHANSRKFGSTNSQNVPDNGIDFSRITITSVVPEPSSVVLMMGALVLLPGLTRRR